MAAKAAGMPIDDNYKEDVFELQHHHLLRCLEKTTVSRLEDVIIEEIQSQNERSFRTSRCSQTASLKCITVTINQYDQE